MTRVVYPVPSHSRRKVGPPVSRTVGGMAPPTTPPGTIIPGAVTVTGTAGTLTVIQQQFVTPAAVTVNATPGTATVGVSAYFDNSAEGGSDETTVTTANSGGASGDAWSAVTITAGATLVFDTAQAAHGALSYRATPATGAAAYGQWTFPTAFTQALVSAYMRRPANTDAENRVIAIRHAAGNAGQVLFLSGPLRFQVRDAAGTAIFTSATVNADTWYRLELRVVRGTTTGNGTIEFGYYIGDSLTPVESVFSSATVNAGTADLTNARVGRNVIADTGTFTGSWFDSVQIFAGTNAAALGNPWPGTATQNITPAPVTVDATAGSLTVINQQQFVTPAPVTVTAAPGTLTVNQQQFVTPAAVTVTATPGTLTVNQQQFVTPAAVTVTATPGGLTVELGAGSAQSITPVAVTVTATTGTLTVAPGPVNITPVSVTVTATTGTLTVTQGPGPPQSITPAAVTVTATGGTLTVTVFVPPTMAGWPIIIFDEPNEIFASDSSNEIVASDSSNEIFIVDPNRTIVAIDPSQTIEVSDPEQALVVTPS